MKGILSIIVIVLLTLCSKLYSQERIVIEGVVPSGYDEDSVLIKIGPFEHIGNAPEWESLRCKINNRFIKAVISTNKPIVVHIPLLSKKFVRLAEPGDSIHFSFNGTKQVYSGKGIKKFELLYEIEQYESNRIRKPENKVWYTTNSIEDFSEWNKYLFDILKNRLMLINAAKSRISDVIYNRITNTMIDDIESMRVMKFWGIIRDGNRMGLSINELCNLFDSTINNTYSVFLRSTSSPIADIHYFESFNQLLILRGFLFNENNADIDTELEQVQLQILVANKFYKGINREKLVAYLLRNYLIKKVGFTKESENILNNYYSESNYPEYKSWVKDYEANARALQKGRPIPDIMLTDKQGNLIANDIFKGKTVLFNFWFTGCKECIPMISTLRTIKEEFKKDSNFVLCCISVDKSSDVWINSIQQSKYSINYGENIALEGRIVNDLILRTLNLTSYPCLILVDSEGKLITSYKDGSINDNKQDLIKLIKDQLSSLHDGPYIFDSAGRKVAYSIKSGKKQVKLVNDTIDVQSNKYNESFKVQLKKFLSNEPSIFSEAEKVLAISDIEGNLTLFTKLLLANKVIDSNFNWIFGKGHLVLVGDFFDRGSQVTECLWLIYSLEEKAKTVGGYVHFILGNHEIMNLSGDQRYVNQKYKNNALIIGRTYKDIYNTQSEIGKWLRTKNIIEKIGNNLFVHGGIGPEIVKQSLSIDDINNLARYYYDKQDLARISSSDSIKGIYDSRTSPFWYRLYYQKENQRVGIAGNKLDTTFKPTMQDIDRVLSHYTASCMITGHTIVSDTISLHYNGKLINIDTPHAKGFSEALLIKGTDFYRVNGDGNCLFLFNSTGHYQTKETLSE